MLNETLHNIGIYIPEWVLGVIWFMFGFITFPIFAYGIWEFWLKKKEIPEDKEVESENENRDNIS